jgi:DNA polymerase-1
LKQLLDDNVIFLDPMKEDKLDVDKFKIEFWFEPKGIIEYLSLTWDSSDNIPWVVWIWPKRATELILKYWDLDWIYAHIDEISEETKNKLLQWKDNAYHSKKLIQLMEVPWIENSNIKDFILNVDFEKYKEILVTDCHFNSFWKVIQELKNKLTAPVQMGLF